MDQQHIEELVKSAFWKLLGKKAYVQGNGFIERLVKLTGLTELAVQGALTGLEKSSWLVGVCDGIPTGKVEPLEKRPSETPPPSFLVWKASLSESGLSEADQEALLPLHVVLDDLKHIDNDILISGLVRLRHEQAAHSGRPAFLVSAEFLLGSSKILDSLPATVLRQFGIDKGKFLGAPPVLLIAGPPNPINVVFIENPHAFWKAVNTSAIEKTAFIVTFGYGLSRHGDEYGNQLASILESGSLVTGAVCAGAPPQVSELLRHQNASFWGDLDLEGLRIYLRLKKIVPVLTLSALYEPMLQAVGNPASSHPYVKVTAKHGQSNRAIQTNDPALSMLASACMDRAVDQERVTSDDIATLAASRFQDPSVLLGVESPGCSDLDKRQ